MMRLLIVVLAICLCLMSGGARCATVDLRGDSRLAARLTLNEPSISVRSLLARVQAECRLELEADSSLRSETVCVCVRNQPCGEVLEQLAQALEFRWSSGSGKPGAAVYRLTEDEGVRLRRARLARQYRREASQELVTQLGLLDRFSRKLRALDSRGVKDELQRLEAAVTALPVSAERHRVELELGAAEQCVEPRRRPLLLALAALPPEARERLIDGERLVMATHHPGALPMPDELVVALREARQALTEENLPAGKRPGAGLIDDEFVDFLSQVSWGQLTFYVRSPGLPGESKRLVYAIPSFLQTPSLVAYGPELSDLRPGAVTADRPEQFRTPVTFDWPTKKLRTDRPLSYHTGVTVAEVLGRLAITDPRWQITGSALLEGIPTVKAGADSGGDQLGVQETAGMLLSKLTEKSRNGSLTLGNLLEPLAERGGVDLRVTRSGWIRFQSTRPFRARERQVDPDVMKAVFGPVVEAKALTPEAGMAAGRLLSRAQTETLSAPYLGFPRHLMQNSGLRSVIDGWRLLDGLPVVDRKALLGGAVVRYARLSEPGRAAVRRYLQEVSLRPNGAPLDLELGARDLPGLQLFLTPGSGSKRVLELRAGSIETLIYATELEAEWSAAR